MNVAKPNTKNTLQCVVQLGFSGSRTLKEGGSSPEFEAKIEKCLVELFQDLPRELQLEEHHFFCGISQLAIGADMVFTRACRTLGIVQRLFLPQTIDVFLTATGSKGPDFSPADKAAAEQLLESPHIIQQHVVSSSPYRNTRFQETSEEMVRVSDVMICLFKDDRPGSEGGTRELLELAKVAGIPTLELTVKEQNGQVTLGKAWHNWPKNVVPDNGSEHHSDERGDGHTLENEEPPWPPNLPAEFAGLHAGAVKHGEQLPSIQAFCEVLKEHCSAIAKKFRDEFAFTARVIIGTHIAATLLATIALVLHARASHDAPLIHCAVLLCLVLEFGMLIWGYYRHHKLHHTAAAENWATNRFIAEINRSVKSVSGVHMYLGYLFWLKLPRSFRAMIRTINVLHLRSSSPRPQWQPGDERWKAIRDDYVHNRFYEPHLGQIGYFADRVKQEGDRLGVAQRVFAVCSAVAIIATLLELLINSDLILHEALKDYDTSIIGIMTVVLPVLAVGVMSWAAAMDYAARVNIFREMEQFLRLQAKRLKDTKSEHEFQRLVMETELRLLGETAEWYSRRSYTGVQ